MAEAASSSSWQSFARPGLPWRGTVLQGMFLSMFCGGALVAGVLGAGQAQAEGPVATSMPTPSAAMRAIQGYWLTEQKDGIFYLGTCGEHEERLCGWLVGLDYQEPRPPVDHWGRSECGLALLLKLKLEVGDVWTGDILDPRSGRIYDANVSLAPDGRVKMRGYLALPILGRTEMLTRYHGSLPGANCRMKVRQK